MDLRKLFLFSGLFKTAKFLVSAPKSVQPCVYISEPGFVSKEQLQMSTGFVLANEVKKGWAVLHPLKYQLYKHGVPVESSAVLAISDRSYVPLDPLGNLKKKEAYKMSALDDIALSKHDAAVADTGKGNDTQNRIQQFIISACFLMLGIYALVTMIKGCG